MSKWGDLLHYAIIKEAFTDESGNLRLKCSDRTIRSLVTGNSFLRHIFCFPKYMDENDILALVGHNSEEYQHFVESLKPLHLAGTLHRAGKSASVVLQNGEEVAVKLTHKTMFEAGIAEGENIHAFGDKDKRHTIKAVVSDELFGMTGLYCGDWERLNALEEFLLLNQPCQQAIKRVMCDRQITRSTLLFLTYVASRSVDGCDLSSNEAIEVAAMEFNQQYAEKLNCIPVCFDDIQCILDVMGIRDTFLPHRRYLGWASDYFGRFLVVYAIVCGLSPWMYANKTIAQVLCDKIPDIYIQTISEYLPHLTDRITYQEIMDEVLASSKTQSYKLSNWEDILFEGLTVSKFEPAYVERAIDILFEDSIAEYQVTDMKRLLSGPNGDSARSYIFKKFFERFNTGEAAYHYAAAAILNAESLEKKGTDPLEEAVESAVLCFGKDDLLLGITRVGLIIWTQLGKRKQLFNEGVVSPVFKETLLENLRSYDKRLYSSTASTVHDLIVSGWFPQGIVNDPEIIQTAVKTLKEQDGMMWAARLISLLPQDDTREIPGDVSDLCAKYMQKMEKALRKEDEEFDPEVYFGLLVNLGWWRNRNLEKFAAFQKIREFYKNEADETQLRRLRLLQNQLDVDNSLK